MRNFARLAMSAENESGKPIEGGFGIPPPLTCAECKLGAFAIYGPTKESAPDEVYIRRRGMRIIAPQKTFMHEGEVPEQIFTLYSGWAYGFTQFKDGRRQILSFLLPGDTIMLENLCFPDLTLPFSVKSLTRLSVCTFSTHDMINLVGASAPQTDKLALCFRNHVVRSNQRLAAIGRRSAVGRMAQLILELESRLSSRNLVTEGKFQFPLRQEHIADALGLTTVYVNRTLRSLRRQNIIDVGRHWMAIRDLPQLKRIADEE